MPEWWRRRFGLLLHANLATVPAWSPLGHHPERYRTHLGEEVGAPPTAAPLVEVLAHFPRLVRLRRALCQRLLETRPDVFIGIDAPDFNLGLEIKLRRAGLRTVQYVSPTVWAWRQRRVRKVARAVDLVLCLFPFEPSFYRDHDVAAAYVGHPLADQIEEDRDAAAARLRLGLDRAAGTVALLPGSRTGEIGRLAEPMIGAAARLAQRRPGMQFVCAAADAAAEDLFGRELQRIGGVDIHVVRSDPRTVIAAADCVLCASGTATLETLLVNRPLVMTYRVAPSTYRIGRLFNLVKLEWFSLPNILAGRGLVPELIQDEATPENLAQAVEAWLDDDAARAALKQAFSELHDNLRCNAADRAAAAVADLLANKGR